MRDPIEIQAYAKNIARELKNSGITDYKDIKQFEKSKTYKRYKEKLKKGIIRRTDFNRLLGLVIQYLEHTEKLKITKKSPLLYTNKIENEYNKLLNLIKLADINSIKRIIYNWRKSNFDINEIILLENGKKYIREYFKSIKDISELLEVQYSKIVNLLVKNGFILNENWFYWYINNPIYKNIPDQQIIEDLIEELKNNINLNVIANIIVSLKKEGVDINNIIKRNFESVKIEKMREIIIDDKEKLIFLLNDVLNAEGLYFILYRIFGNLLGYYLCRKNFLYKIDQYESIIQLIEDKGYLKEMLELDKTYGLIKNKIFKIIHYNYDKQSNSNIEQKNIIYNFINNLKKYGLYIDQDFKNKIKKELS